MKQNRVTADLSQTSAESLERLCDQLETTKSEVIRRAISLLDMVISDTDRRQRRLAIVDEDGRVVKELVVL